MNLFGHRISELTKDDERILREYFSGYDYRGASYTFLATYIWRDDYEICWDIIEGYLCMVFCMTGEDARYGPAMSMPLTKDGSYDPVRLRAALLECKRLFDEAGVPLTVRNIPAHLADVVMEAVGSDGELVRTPYADEYVYLKEKLIDLSGRALHKKKNHLNFFLRSYEYEVRPVTRSMKEEIMELSDRIKEIKEKDPDEVDDLEEEHNALLNMIEMAECSEVYSAAVFINGQLEAFALGETMSEDTAAEHFEKANSSYRGLYQLICREFCRALPENIVYVNREEDMGLPNLRQAKEALKPDHMEERYVFKFVS